MNPPLAATITIIAAALFPYIVMIHSMPLSGLQMALDAMLWGFSPGARTPLDIYRFGFINPILAFRYWTIFEVYRSYEGLHSRRRVLLAAFITELILVATYLINNLLHPSGLQPPLLHFSVPLPTFLLSVVLLVYIFPPSKLPETAWNE